jgi:hypothetical protein
MFWAKALSTQGLFNVLPVVVIRSRGSDQRKIVISRQKIANIDFSGGLVPGF